MLQLRERIDLSPSLLEFSFRNRFLQKCFGGLSFYFIRRLLYRRTFLHRAMMRRTCLNERIVEYPYVFQQISQQANISTVLDIGSSYSLLPIQLATLGYRVTGLDLCDSGDTYHPCCQHVVSDLFDNHLPENSFDCVVSVSTIEHMGFGEFGDKVIDDADFKAFEIVRKLLKPGGLAIITVPVMEASSYWYDKTTLFSKERIDALVSPFDVVDRRFMHRELRNTGNAEIDFFENSDDVKGYGVHLLTLRKAAR